MTTLELRIKELVQFYVKTNYEKYLSDNSLKCIPVDQVDTVVRNLYTDRKEHLKVFVKESLKQLLQGDYPGDLVILNILLAVFEDDELCINRVIMEIKLHQQTVTDGRVEYSSLK